MGTAKANGTPSLLYMGFPENWGMYARRIWLPMLGKLQCARSLAMTTCTVQYCLLML